MGEFFSRGQQGPQPVVLPSRLSQEAPILNAFWDAQAARQANATNQQQNAIQAVLGAGQLQQKQQESLANQQLAQQELEANRIAKQQAFDLQNQGLQIDKSNAGVAQLEQARKQQETDFTIKEQQRKLELNKKIQKAWIDGDEEEVDRLLVGEYPDKYRELAKNKLDVIKSSMDIRQKALESELKSKELYNTKVDDAALKADQLVNMPAGPERDALFEQYKPTFQDIGLNMDKFDPVAIQQVRYRSKQLAKEVDMANADIPAEQIKTITNSDMILKQLDGMEDVLQNIDGFDKLASWGNATWAGRPDAERYNARMALAVETMTNLMTGAAATDPQVARYKTALEGLQRGNGITKEVWEDIREWARDQRNLALGNAKPKNYTPYQIKYGRDKGKKSEVAQGATAVTSGIEVTDDGYVVSRTGRKYRKIN